MLTPTWKSISLLLMHLTTLSMCVMVKTVLLEYFIKICSYRNMMYSSRKIFVAIYSYIYTVFVVNGFARLSQTKSFISLFLNQARAWFLEITFIPPVYVHPRGYK